MRRGPLIGLIGGVLAVAAVAAFFVLHRTSPSGPEPEVAAYLKAWRSFDAGAMAKVVDKPTPDFAAAVTNMGKDLHAPAATFQATGVKRHGNSADASFSASIPLGGLDTWTYDGSIHLVHTGQGWRVQWTPASLHPDLATGQRFGTTRTWPARAAILGAGGQPLASQSDVVIVGIEPDHMTDRNQVKAALQQQLQVDPAKVDTALAAPGIKPNFFVPIQPLRPDRFAQLKATLAPVPGIVFQKSTARLTASDGLAPQTVGTVGEITADQLKSLAAPYQVGDTVGQTGLEAAFERQLAGRPSGQIRTVDAAGKPVKTLKEFQGAPPQPVSASLDLRTQLAAEQALATLPPSQPAALVALDATTGDIKAVVSHPLDQPFNRALAGRYPPGSTFKVVTSAALLASGTTAATPITCPAQVAVGGKPFTNFEGEAPAGTIPFHQAFAISCNTAFVQLATKLPDPALTTAATSFGFGDKYQLPLPSFGGDFPKPADTAEVAAASIGQGRVLASPLQMASVAAAVGGGGWRPPHLVPTDQPAPVKPLDATTATALKALMTEVVQSPGATGTAAAVPGQAIAGKTGTAEFGPGNPPATHAWFIGFRGNLAFAVLVEGGGVGGRVAAPLAAKFLAALPA